MCPKMLLDDGLWPHKMRCKRKLPKIHKSQMQMFGTPAQSSVNCFLFPGLWLAAPRRWKLQTSTPCHEDGASKQHNTWRMGSQWMVSVVNFVASIAPPVGSPQSLCIGLSSSTAGRRHLAQKWPSAACHQSAQGPKRGTVGTPCRSPAPKSLAPSRLVCDCGVLWTCVDVVQKGLLFQYCIPTNARGSSIPLQHIANCWLLHIADCPTG